MDFTLESKSENIGLQLENKCHYENRIYYLSSLCSLHCFKTSPSKRKFNIALQYFEKIHLVSQMSQCVSANHNTHFKIYLSNVQDMNRSTWCEIESTLNQAQYEKKGLLGSLNMLTAVTPFKYSLCCSNVTFIAMLYINEVSKFINIYFLS